MARRQLGTTGASNTDALARMSDVSAAIAALPGAVTDLRKFAKWYATNYATKKVVFWGDSTTEQLYSLGLIPANGKSDYMAGEFPALANVNFRNHGSNGAMTRDLTAYGNAGSANSAGNYCQVDDVIATAPDLIFASMGLNDWRGAITPGSAGNPLGGNYPDYRVAYGAAGNVQAALVQQFWMKRAIDRIRATLPNCVIVWVMPNALTTDCIYMANSVTPQQCMDVNRLAYRGDASLSVPRIEDYAAGVLMMDTMATLNNTLVYPSANDQINNPNDGLHPTPGMYRGRLYLAGKLMTGDGGDAIPTAARALQLKGIEKSIAGGWQAGKESLDALYYSGEYEQVYTVSVSTSNASFFDMGLGPTANSGPHAWGGASNDPRGNLAPPGLAVGDVIVWNIAGVPSIRVVTTPADALPALYMRWYSGVDIHGKAFPSDLAAGTQGVVYRHKFANSVVGRKNLDRLAGTPEQIGSAYRAPYQFVIESGGSGTFTARGIGGESPFNLPGRTASEHIWSKLDMLGIAGVEGRALAASFDTYFGLPLVSATFSQNGQSVTVTQSGTNFANAVGQQGVLLTRDDAGSLTVDQAKALSSITYKNSQRLQPATGTTVPTVMGMTWTGVGTLSHPTQALTNLQTSLRRANYASAAAASSGCGGREPTATKVRGNVTGLGGFTEKIRFTQATNVTGHAVFAGLTASVAALAGNPSALVNIIGVGYDSGDANTGNWYLMTNDASGTATRSAVTGAGGANGLAACVRDTTSVMLLTLKARPNSGQVFVSLVNESTGTVIYDNYPVNADLPAAATYLATRVEGYTGSSTTAQQIAVVDIDVGYNE